jgi:Mrp family chromosome partitioning ATPase
MQKSFRIVFAAALIGLGIWAWRMWFPSPENVIRSRLLKLARTASFDATDRTLSKGLKVYELLDYFTPDVVINLNVRGIEVHTLNGRDELQQAALAAANSEAARGLKVEFLDIDVTLGPDRQTATVNLTGEATVAAERDLIVQKFNFLLKKVEGKWLIYRVEAVKVLSRSQTVRRIQRVPA